MKVNFSFTLKPFIKKLSSSEINRDDSSWMFYVLLIAKCCISYQTSVPCCRRNLPKLAVQMGL